MKGLINTLSYKQSSREIALGLQLINILTVSCSSWDGSFLTVGSFTSMEISAPSLDECGVHRMGHKELGKHPRYLFLFSSKMLSVHFHSRAQIKAGPGHRSKPHCRVAPIPSPTSPAVYQVDSPEHTAQNVRNQQTCGLRPAPRHLRRTETAPTSHRPPLRGLTRPGRLS